MIRNRTVILVEDSATDRLLFSKYLEQMGCTCLCMGNAEILISQIDTFESSVILMNIEMPGISGIEASGILKKKMATTENKHVIIALSAHNNNEIHRIAIEAGFDDFIQKPISEKDFKIRLSRYIKDSIDHLPDFNKEFEGSKEFPKLYSLEMFDVDDPEFVSSIVEMFIENTPKSISAIRNSFLQTNMEMLSQFAHKLKPHFGYFGVFGMQEILQTIEDIARGKGNIAELPKLVDCLEKNSALVVEQLKNDFFA